MLEILDGFELKNYLTRGEREIVIRAHVMQS